MVRDVDSGPEASGSGGMDAGTVRFRGNAGLEAGCKHVSKDTRSLLGKFLNDHSTQAECLGAGALTSHLGEPFSPSLLFKDYSCLSQRTWLSFVGQPASKSRDGISPLPTSSTNLLPRIQFRT